MIRKLLDFTTTPLGINGDYTSQWFQAEWVNYIIASSLADQAGELFLEWSDDGATVHSAYRLATTANIPAYIGLVNALRYVRVRYKNGATAQTSFRCALIAVYYTTA